MKWRKSSARLSTVAGHGLYTIFIYVLLFGLAFVFLYPYLYMLTTSFKSYNDLINSTVKWFPKEFAPENYRLAAQALDFVHSGLNTIFVAGVSTIGHVFVCSFVAYGFARFQFVGRNILFAVVILSIVVPVQTLIVPQYITWVNLNVADSYWPIILPTFLGYGLRGGLFIFLFNQQFIKLPRVLEEAAEIDGCGPIRTFFRIALPTAGATIVVCAVLSVVWHWNEFFESSIYISRQSEWLLPQSLPSMYSLIQSLATAEQPWMMEMQFTYHEGVVMAGTALATLPLLIFYMFMQRKFMASIERSGIVE